MKNDELKTIIEAADLGWFYGWMQDALLAVVELCKEAENDIDVSGFAEGIIKTIEKKYNNE